MLKGMLMLAAAGGCSAAPGGHRALRVRGADLSFTLQEEAAGITFSSAAGTAPVERILADVGATYVRLRLWVNPTPGTSDEVSALALARRARDAGLKLLLSLHYADSWADHRAQETPAAWRTHQLPVLAQVVHDYTKRVLSSFADHGTPVDMVQIGNEITHGMLWPVGRLRDGDDRSAVALAALLQAGITGARAGSPSGHELEVMLHVHNGQDSSACQQFFDRIRGAGIRDFDVIGLSYYPFSGGSFADLARSLGDLAQRYARDLVIVETAYPWTLSHSDGAAVLKDRSQLPDPLGYPATPAGQRDYFLMLRRMLADVRGGRGAGLIAWGAEWLPPVPASVQAGNTYANLTLFDAAGRALPALDVAFRSPHG